MCRPATPPVQKARHRCSLNGFLSRRRRGRRDSVSVARSATVGIGRECRDLPRPFGRGASRTSGRAAAVRGSLRWARAHRRRPLRLWPNRARRMRPRGCGGTGCSSGCWCRRRSLEGIAAPRRRSGGRWRSRCALAARVPAAVAPHPPARDGLAIVFGALIVLNIACDARSTPDPWGSTRASTSCCSPTRCFAGGAGARSLLGLPIIARAPTRSGSPPTTPPWAWPSRGACSPLFPAVLGAAVRFQVPYRLRERDQVMLHERERARPRAARHRRSPRLGHRHPRPGRARRRGHRPGRCRRRAAVIEDEASRALDRDAPHGRRACATATRPTSRRSPVSATSNGWPAASATRRA